MDYSTTSVVTPTARAHDNRSPSLPSDSLNSSAFFHGSMAESLSGDTVRRDYEFLGSSSPLPRHSPPLFIPPPPAPINPVCGGTASSTTTPTATAKTCTATTTGKGAVAPPPTTTTSYTPHLSRGNHDIRAAAPTPPMQRSAYQPLKPLLPMDGSPVCGDLKSTPTRVYVSNVKTPT